MRNAYLAALLGICLAAKPAEAAPPARTHIELAAVQAGPDIPAAAVDLVRTTFPKLVSAHPTLDAALTGAPDPGDQTAYRAWLKKRNLRVFSVAVKVTEYSRELGPDPKSPRGQLLSVHVAVSLLGDIVPDGTMGLAGTGAETISTQVGAAPSARDEESTLRDVIEDALGQALTEAVAKLDAPPAKKTKPTKSKKGSVKK